MNTSLYMICILLLTVIFAVVSTYAIQCPVNEQYHECGTACQENCTHTPPFCTYQCVPGCFCKQGFVRKSGDKSACVPRSQCSCGVNEYFNDCGSACPDTCSARSQLCTKQCIPGCFCRDGFVRVNNQSGSACIAESECKQSPCQDPNAEYTECGSACPRTCADELNPVRKFRVCSIACRHGCSCKKGFVLGKDGQCVRPESCCRAINAVYRTCGSLCPQTCADQHNYSCLLPCASGCFCATDYKRKNDDVNSPCIHETSCLDRR